MLFALDDDRRPGTCDRCCNPAMVTPEIGPAAENVCTPCLERERMADYLEYLALLNQGRGLLMSHSRQAG